MTVNALFQHVTCPVAGNWCVAGGVAPLNAAARLAAAASTIASMAAVSPTVGHSPSFSAFSNAVVNFAMHPSKFAAFPCT
jgi:hypothetical protein